MNGTGPIRSIVVVGAGLVGLSAALAFAGALPRAKIKVLAVPMHPAALADRLLGTLPATADQLDLLGIDEVDLVRAGAATHRLADRFEGWRLDGSAWLHGFGETGVPVANGAFHQHWADAQRGRANAPFYRFAPAAALAEADRFVHPADDSRSLLSRFDYALRLDPVIAGRLFAQRAAERGIAIVPGEVRSVSRGSGGAAEAIELDGDRRWTADLFIDCSGPASMLGAPGDWVDWTGALPADRLLLASGPGAPSPVDDYRAVEIGWRATWPGRDRATVGLAYAGDLTPEARARQLFGEAGAVAEAIALRPGRRLAPWRGNVLALGDAAVASGPLGRTGLALAHAGLALALELLPARDLHPRVLAEYNRRTALAADRVRDFLALHYLGSTRRAGPFWRTLRDRPRPPDLAATLDTFARRGQLPRYEEELFDKESWLAVLLGLGLTPAGRDPTIMGGDPAEIAGTMARLQAAVAALPASLPPYPDYLARMTAGR